VDDDPEFIKTCDPKSVFESSVRVYELLGAEVYLYFDLEEFPITARVAPNTTSRPGDSIKFAFEVDKIHVFDKETEQVITN
ncbi:MAG: TOBE domain-containing protein, partial [Lachnospiraceae bacterium]|nr:TOBE domain-containing protein [Lachnospiraceae bacterium]